MKNALYEARMAEALRESQEDFAQGRFYSSKADLLAAVERKRTKLD